MTIPAFAPAAVASLDAHVRRLAEPDSDVPTPFTVFALSSAMAAYAELTQALPVEVWYAVKAAPIPQLLRQLAATGTCCFDVASPAEIDLALQAGARPEQLSYGNPIRSADEVSFAAAAGVRTWVVDTALEVQRVALAAPGSRVVIRLANSGQGADWPLSGKFGCSADQAADLARLAASYHLDVAGLSWHVGSQQRRVDGWDTALRQAAELWHALAAEGIQMRLLNLGGGLPGGGYRTAAAPLAHYAEEILRSVDRYFPDQRPQLVAEPGRSLVAAAGATVTTVKAVTQRPDGRTYAFLDGGVFSIGLVEAIDAVIEYRVESLHHTENAELMPVALVGPTRDSLDEIAARTPYELPTTLAPGDLVKIASTGAYTWSYSSTHFNGYQPARLVVVE